MKPLTNIHTPLCATIATIVTLLVILSNRAVQAVPHISAARQHFAYERGSCEVSLTNTLTEVLETEVRSIMKPWHRRIITKHKKLRFDLYTPRNPRQAQILRTGDVEGLRRSNFQPQWPVRVIIHGWTGKATSCSNAALKDAYIERVDGQIGSGEFNVIIVDWSAHSLDMSYARIARQLPDIAATIKSFLQFLHDVTGAPFERMYLIGHSAGSHIAGWTGKHLWPQRLGAIYALDPAGLTHLGANKGQRLAPSDALYVETIHSDVTMLGNPSVRLGHAAFFANWAQGQPHCPNGTAVELEFACDHFAALYYFAESVRQGARAFGAVRCTAKTANDADAGGGAGGDGNDPARSRLEGDNDGGSRENALNIDDYACGCTRPTHTVAVTTATTAALTLTASAAAAATHQPDRFDCPADVFMGGEPAVTTKRGVYYFSTAARPPYGLGALVRVRPPAPSSVLRTGMASRLTATTTSSEQRRLLPLSLKFLKLGLIF